MNLINFLLGRENPDYIIRGNLAVTGWGLPGGYSIKAVIE